LLQPELIGCFTGDPEKPEIFQIATKHASIDRHGRIQGPSITDSTLGIATI
jgi:hypothetical protein